jgi:putative membrane protein
MRSWNRIGFLWALALGAASVAAAQASDPHAGHKPGTVGDQSFAEKAGLAGMMEVEAGRLALQKSSNEIRAFAQKMIDHHTKAGEELKAAASQENVTVPASLDAKHQEVLDKLKGVSGASFDAAYKAQMVKDHREAVALFEKESTSGQSALDKFASSTLPTLRQHLKMAEELPGQAAANP